MAKKRKVDDIPQHLLPSKLDIDTLNTLSAQRKAATGRWGRVPVKKSSYHDEPYKEGLGDFSIAPTQSRLSGGLPPKEPQFQPAPVIPPPVIRPPVVGGESDVESVDIPFGETAGERLALDVTMEDVIDEMIGVGVSGATKGAEVAAAGFPEFAPQAALATTLAPMKLAKTFVGAGIPAGMAAKKYAPQFEDIYGEYGEDYGADKTGKQLRQEIDDAVQDLQNPDWGAPGEFGEEGRLTPGHATRMAEMMGLAKEESRSYQGQLWDWIKKQVKGSPGEGGGADTMGSLRGLDVLDTLVDPNLDPLGKLGEIAKPDEPFDLTRPDFMGGSGEYGGPSSPSVGHSDVGMGLRGPGGKMDDGDFDGLGFL